MKRSMTLMLLSVMIFTLVLSGCSGNTTQKENTDNTVSAGVAKEELIIGFGADIEGLNPTDFVGPKHSALSLVYETLVKCDNGKIEPSLAESWEISPDGKEYIFKLKKGVQFSDGTPFNAEAVKKNIELFSKSNYTSFGVVSNFSSVEIMDEYTVKLSLTEPFYAILNDLSVYVPFAMVSPDTIDSNDPIVINGSIGTGPYVLSEYESNQSYTFVRNENYWGEKPRFKNITLKIIPHENSRILALKSGEVDMILGAEFLSYDAVKQIENDSNFTIQISETASSTRLLCLNTASELLEDVSIRKAIAYAINKDELTECLFYGHEARADTLLDENLPYCDVDTRPYEYDLEKANQLLDETGWLQVNGSEYRQKDGKELKLRVTYRTEVASSKEIAEALRGYLHKIGISCETVGTDTVTWYVDGLEGKFDITIHATLGIAYDPQYFIVPMSGDCVEAISLEGLSMKTEVIENINKISSSNNEKLIADAYKYVLGTLHNEVAMIPISRRKEMIVYNNEKIKDYIFAEYPEMVLPDNVK